VPHFLIALHTVRGGSEKNLTHGWDIENELMGTYGKQNRTRPMRGNLKWLKVFDSFVMPVAERLRPGPTATHTTLINMGRNNTLITLIIKVFPNV